jgi:multiple sugar transport system substrate-binding protein
MYSNKTYKGERILKKYISISFLCFLLIWTTACNNNGSSEDVSGGSSSDVTKVVFWDLFSGSDGQVMTEIVKEFNKEHSDIKVEKITQEWGEYYTKLTTSVLGNKSPDLGVSHATRVPMLKEQGVIQPIGELASNNGIDFANFAGVAVDTTTIEGEKYAVPLDYHAFLLFYNKKVLGDMNLLNENGEPEFSGYDEFIQLLKTVTEKDGNINPLALGGQGTHPLRLWYTFYKQMGGGDIYDNSGATIDKAIGEKSLRAVYDLYNTHKVVPPKIESIDQMFQSGEAAFMINGTWAVNDTFNALGEDLGVMKFPTFFDKASVYADSHTFILPTSPNRNEKTTAAALTFVKWVTDNGWKWSKAGHLPTSKTVLESEELKSQPFRSNYESEVEYMEFLPPAKNVWFANSSELVDVLDGLWINNYSVEEGLQKVEAVINKQLEEN